MVTFNAIGILLAALDRFPYARNNNGAFILGNLMTAVLVRAYKSLLTLVATDIAAFPDAQ